MVPELRFEVITDPVAKARPRVRVRGRHAHVYTPAKTQEAEWRIRSAFVERFPRLTPLLGPITLEIIAWLPMPVSTPKRLRPTAQPVKRPDVDNYLKLVLDGLDRVAFADDSQVVSVTCSKRYCREGEPPAWSITIRHEPQPTPRQESQQCVTAPGDSAHGTSASAG